MNVVGVIPARWGSVRFPGKSLALICGRPLIRHVAERALRARRLDRLMVASDDERILNAVSGLEVEPVLTRGDHASGTDRVAEAVQGCGAGVVVNIQGDEPLVDPDLIDRLADVMLAGGGWDMATAAERIRDAAALANPSVVKVVCGEGGRALYFSRAPIPFVRDGGGQPTEDLHWRHLGIYAYRRAFLQRLVGTPPCALERAEKLEQLRALHIGGRIVVLRTEQEGIGVDTPEDLQRVERMMRKRNEAHRPPITDKR